MLASTRFIVSSFLIFGIAKILKIPIRITRKQFFNTAIAGFLFLTFGNGLVVWTLKYVDSGFAALEISAPVPSAPAAPSESAHAPLRHKSHLF